MAVLVECFSVVVRRERMPVVLSGRRCRPEDVAEHRPASGTGRPRRGHVTSRPQMQPTPDARYLTR